MNEQYYSRAFPVRVGPVQGYLFDPTNGQKYELDDFSKFLDTMFLCIESNLGLKRKLIQPINEVVNFTNNELIIGLNFSKAISELCGISEVFTSRDFNNPDSGLITFSRNYEGLPIECILHIDKRFFDTHFNKIVNIFKNNQSLIARTKVIQKLLLDDQNLYKNVKHLRKEINMSNIGADFMNVNPIFQARNLTINPDEAFYIMHFGENRENIFNILSKSIGEKYGIQLIKSGDKTFNFNKTIMESIWTHINMSPFVIADISDRNPNVFYELGICHTIGKTVIPLCDEESMKNDYNNSFPFDIADRPVVIYKNAIGGESDLISRVSAAIDSILNQTKNTQ